MTFLSKVTLFTKTITTSTGILVFQYSMSLLRRQVKVFPKQHTLKYVESSIEKVSIYYSGDVNSTSNKYYILFFRTVLYTLNLIFMMNKIMST